MARSRRGDYSTVVSREILVLRYTCLESGSRSRRSLLGRLARQQCKSCKAQLYTLRSHVRWLCKARAHYRRRVLRVHVLRRLHALEQQQRRREISCALVRLAAAASCCIRLCRRDAPNCSARVCAFQAQTMFPCWLTRTLQHALQISAHVHGPATAWVGGPRMYKRPLHWPKASVEEENVPPICLVILRLTHLRALLNLNSLCRNCWSSSSAQRQQPTKAFPARISAVKSRHLRRGVAEAYWFNL